MGAEDHRHPLGDFIDILDEDHPTLFKAPDHPFVVDDGVSNVDGGAVNLERKVDDLDRKGDSGTKSSRGS